MCSTSRKTGSTSLRQQGLWVESVPIWQTCESSRTQQLLQMEICWRIVFQEVDWETIGKATCSGTFRWTEQKWRDQSRNACSHYQATYVSVLLILWDRKHQPGEYVESMILGPQGTGKRRTNGRSTDRKNSRLALTNADLFPSKTLNMSG